MFAEEGKFTLVLQWRSTGGGAEFERLVQREDAIERGLADGSIVDGHDMGLEETNIFIFTDTPRVTFERCEAILRAAGCSPPARAAFRPAYGEGFTVLAPEDLPDDEFIVS